MSDRPKRYATQTPVRGGSAPLQYIHWQAETATADGLTLNDFLRTMARRFMTKTRPSMHRDAAYDMAISVLQSLTSLGDVYGDPAYDWSHGGAREMADDEMSQWETEGSGGNA